MSPPSSERLLPAVLAQLTHESRRRLRADTTARGGIRVEPLDEALDHVRGPAGGGVILEYGDYECPYTRAAYRQIRRVQSQVGADARVAFRHELDLDVLLFDSDRNSAAVLRRVGRDIESGLASGQVMGTPTLFIDGVVHRGGDAAQLLDAVRAGNGRG